MVFLAGFFLFLLFSDFLELPGLFQDPSRTRWLVSSPVSKLPQEEHCSQSPSVCPFAIAS